MWVVTYYFQLATCAIIRRSMKKIVTTTASFSDTVEKTDLKEKLAAQGIEVILHYDFKNPLPFDAADVFAIVAGHTPQGEMLYISTAVTKLFPNLKVVSPFGIGANHLDLEGLKNIGLAIVTVPHFSKHTVAELAMANMFAMARRLVQQTVAIRSGEWKRQNGATINSKTLGIIGLGSIGKEVAKLGVGVGMRVVGYDIVYDEVFMKEFGIERADIDTIVKTSDFLTLHVPYLPETRNLLNRERVMAMRKGAFLVNVARGEVIDEKAVLEALESGQLASAAIDVFSKEPPFTDEVLARLVKHPNVIATPHVGAFTPETRYSIADYICKELEPYARS
jgi:D-3-phosphoglycerate dehydrogenase